MQELYALISTGSSPQTSIGYYGNKIDSITITRLDTNQSVTCPYYTQAEGDRVGHQNLYSGVSLFTHADIGKEIWLNITIP